MRKLNRTFDFTRRNKETRQDDKVGSLQFRSSGAKAELLFYGDICSSSWDLWQAEDKCPQDISDFLRDLNTFSELEIHINSGGGDVFGGVAIYNLLKRHAGQKTVYIDGLAASIASVIALSGDTVLMHPGTQFMIHKPWSYCIGDSDDMVRLAMQLEQIEENILDIYMEHTQDGVTREQVQAMVDAETWMNGEEAVRYFKIDLAPGAAAAACASDYFDRYKHTPETLTTARADQTQQEERERLQLALDLLRL